MELKINTVKEKHIKFKNNNMLHSDSIKNYLEELHQRFIVTLIDKANLNVVVMKL